MRFLTFDQLTEARAEELASGSNRGNPFTPHRAEYVGMSFRLKRLRFRVGKYRQEVEIPGMKVISKLRGTDAEKVSTALSGDVRVHCSCPDHRYGGWQYLGTVLGYSIHPESRPPVVRNPTEEGTVCKHLRHLLSRIDDYTDDIAADFERSRATKWYSAISRETE